MPRADMNCFGPVSKKLATLPGTPLHTSGPHCAAASQWRIALQRVCFVTDSTRSPFFHAVRSSGAIPGSIVTLRPGESEFRQTDAITRGTRPLHITSAPGGAVYWGEYFDNAQRDEVHIYGSADAGITWSIAYTLPKGSVRHVHNIVHDPWAIASGYLPVTRVTSAAFFAPPVTSPAWI